MKLSALTIFTLAFCIVLSLAFRDSGKELFDKIDSYLAELEANGDAGQVLVAVKGEVYSKGYGMSDREAEKEFTPETIVGTGSITKQFTGGAILKLEMQGKLSTNDLMSKYFQNVPADKSAITLHHLLTHSAGFPGAIGDDYTEISGEAFVEKAMKSQLAFEPGAGYEYSNVGFSLLAIMVESLSGMTYEEYLKKEMFDPAGMKNTGYVKPDWKGKDVAVGYSKDKKWGRLNEKNWGEDGPYWHLKGNGGILSTGEDMYKWHLALADEKILSEEAKKKYYGKHVDEGGGSFYGYGWSIYPTPRGTDLITHNGGNQIFFADFLRYNEEDVVIWYATNSANRKNERVAWEIARMVLQPEYQAKVRIETDEMQELSEEEEAVKISFIEMLQGDEAKSIEEFVRTQFDQGMIEMAPMKEHLRFLGNLRAELQSAKYLSARHDYDGMILSYDGSQGEIQVVINVERGKIVGMGVD